MRIVKATLRSLSPYSQSRAHFTPKLNKEGPDAYEERTWRERINATPEGNVFIPPMAFKNCLSEIAKFLGRQIPGKGKSTWTKHFEAGVLVMDGLVLPDKKADVAYEQLFVPADGKRGGGRRVRKYFPVIPSWKGDVEFVVFDDVITKEVFEEHLREAGSFIGVGRFRPRNNGFYGRFEVVKTEWTTK